MKICMLFLTLASVGSMYKGHSQTNGLQRSNNLVKFNFSPVLVNNYVVQYERVISGKQSIAVSLGYSPNSKVPFRKTLSERFSLYADAKNAIEQTRYKKFNATLEYRFYTAANAPDGFYIAPFVRYMNMQINQDYQFTPVNSTVHTITLKSRFNGIAPGVLVGYQWLLSKKWGLDFWIAGPFFAPTMRATFTGYDPIGNLSAVDQAELKRRIEGGDLPGYKIKATVSQNTDGPTTVTATIKGPYYGVRGLGLCLLYHF